MFELCLAGATGGVGTALSALTLDGKTDRVCPLAVVVGWECRLRRGLHTALCCCAEALGPERRAPRLTHTAAPTTAAPSGSKFGDGAAESDGVGSSKGRFPKPLLLAVSFELHLSFEDLVGQHAVTPTPDGSQGGPV